MILNKKKVKYIKNFHSLILDISCRGLELKNYHKIIEILF